MVAIGADSGAKKSRNNISRMLESCLGCKWTLMVLAQVRKGVHRPGALVRSLPGLTTKVLNERLTKLVRFDVLDRRSYPEVPPRVEYRLTPFGRKFVKIIDSIEELEQARAASEP